MSAISVVVPIYNAGQKLKKCIKSILDQTFLDFELILVNDGSTDHSLDICRTYVDKRVIVIDKQNEGSIATRKVGVERASSNYVTFVDADDWIDSNYLLFLYREIVNNNTDVVCCTFYKTIDGFGFIKKAFTSQYYHNDKLYTGDRVRTELAGALFHGHPFHSGLCAKLYKKELLLCSGKYLDRIKFFGDDLYYNLEILLKSKTVKCIDKPLYYYRTGGFSSKFMSYLFDDMINGYEIQKEVIADYYQETRDKQYYGISIMLLNTFKTCLKNLFSSKMNKLEIRKLVEIYISNNAVIECLSNKGCIKHFSSDYLNAIKNKDIKYLYNMGQKMHIESLPKKYLMNIISRIL